MMLLRDPNPALVRFYTLKALVLSLYLILALGTHPWRADDRPVVRWTRWCLVALMGLGALTLGLNVAGRYGVNLPVDSDRATGAAVTVGVYCLALAVLRGRSGAGVAAAVAPSYRTSPLDDPAKIAIADRVLSHWAARRPHRDPDLTLEALAHDMAVPGHHLSQVFNEQLGEGFYGFVNGRRVADLEALLADASRDGDTVLRLGLEAGFNSKATLNRVFRQSTGMTPSEFRRQAQEARPSA
jgi:AraC-like DNA-binding protein